MEGRELISKALHGYRRNGDSWTIWFNRICISWNYITMWKWNVENQDFLKTQLVFFRILVIPCHKNSCWFGVCNFSLINIKTKMNFRKFSKKIDGILWCWSMDAILVEIHLIFLLNFNANLHTFIWRYVDFSYCTSIYNSD